MGSNLQYATGVINNLGKAQECDDPESEELPIQQSPFFTHERWGGDYWRNLSFSGYFPAGIFSIDLF